MEAQEKTRATLLLKNAKIVNEGVIFNGGILIDGERIADVFSYDLPEDLQRENDCAATAVETVDLDGLYVAPGIIDDHVHFREPGNTSKGCIESESAAAVIGGVTSYMDMPNNTPSVCSMAAIQNKMEIARQGSYANYSFYIGASNDNVDEIKSVDRRKVCGVKVFIGSSTGSLLLDDPVALDAVFFRSPILIAVHAEDNRIINDNLEAMKVRFGQDIPFSKHPMIRSREACIKATRTAVNLALKYNARLHLLHVSTKDEVDYLRDVSLTNPNITGEACVSYLRYSKEDYYSYGAKVKCNPAIKERSDRDAIRNAVVDGTLSVIATDHAPHLLAEKQNGYLKAPSGIPMVQHSFLTMLDMVKEGIFKLETVVSRMSHGPALLFNVVDRGFIRKGFYADLVVFDMEKPSLSPPAYRCGWCLNDSFSSTICRTYVNGTLVALEGKLTGEKNSMALEFDR